MRGIYVGDRIAVARHPSVAVEAPVVPEDVLQQELVRARRDPVHGVVRAHDARHLRVAHARLERGQVVLGEVLLRDHRVEPVALDALPVVEVVGCEVLAVGDDFEVGLGVDAALEADDEVVDVVLEMEGVFSWCLLTTTPARILESWVMHAQSFSYEYRE